MTEVVLEPQESGRENEAVHTNGDSRNGGVLSVLSYLVNSGLWSYDKLLVPVIPCNSSCDTLSKLVTI